MSNSKPYVSAACVCENVLQEKDGVFSAIRIVDTFKVRVAPSDTTPDVNRPIDLRVLVALKSVDLAGDFTLLMVLVYPSGAQKELPPFSVSLKGSLGGYNIGLRLGIEVREFGDYRFDVLWEGDLLTRIPFRITREETPAQPETSSS